MDNVLEAREPQGDGPWMCLEIADHCAEAADLLAYKPGTPMSWRILNIALLMAAEVGVEVSDMRRQYIVQEQ